jgi:hypothetical protein
MNSHRSSVRFISRLLTAFGLLAAVASPTFAAAEALATVVAEPRSGPPAPREPPPFAFEACADKQEGAACSVTMHDRTLDGSCVTGHDDRLFCRPDNMPPPPARDHEQGPTR